MTKENIYFAEGDNPEMLQAFQKAQETFKYFWRELSWEYRRIIPALDVACIKVAFVEHSQESNLPIVEHMWVNEIEFNGEVISGRLVNEPNELSNVKNGDSIQIPLSQLSDWLFVSRGKTYGGFTIQLMRANMSESERQSHDEAWGLNFGDFNDILVAYEQKEYPENMIEHPMSLNMQEKLNDFVKSNPEEVSGQDELGYTFLHRETIAGNKASVEILLKAGANREAKNYAGKTALDYAQELQWTHIIPILKK